MSLFTYDDLYDLRALADDCCDEGALVYEHELPALIEELENRYGETPSEDAIIDYAVAEYWRRVDREAGSLAKYDTTPF